MSSHTRNTVLPSNGKIRSKNGKCVTVKAEDRPSGSAGDSASVITFLFRLQPGLVEWRVLVAAARQRRRSRIKDKHTPRLQIRKTVFNKVLNLRCI